MEEAAAIDKTHLTHWSHFVLPIQVLHIDKRLVDGAHMWLLRMVHDRDFEALQRSDRLFH